MESVIQKFLRYARIDTPSDEGNFSSTPSSDCQRNLAEALKEELAALGLEVRLGEDCYLYAHIPANCGGKPALGFIAHLDVVSEPKGFGVKPQLHKNYSGGDICLSNGVKIGAEDMRDCIGLDIITSDGTTVLGADDKAGVAEIMALAEYLCAHPEIKHGKIGIAFTPDEEIGHGARLFDVKGFGCDYAYTVDGETLGEISYETFNGAAFTATFKGVNIHPGQAKGRMVNALICANQFISRFPADERPETTEGREGYYFFNDIRGGVEECKLTGIIRDHDSEGFAARKKFVEQVAAEFPAKIEMRDQYYNCASVIKPVFHIVEAAAEAMRLNGVEPIIQPIRGGTDGSGLSFMGLPCPNICTGGRNAHGLNEFVPAQHLERVTQILLDIVRLAAD